MTHRTETILSRIVGVSLLLVGVGFFVLFAVVATSVAPSEAWKLSQYLSMALFMVGFGASLVWIGWTFLRPEPQREAELELDRWPDLERSLVKCRPMVQFFAAAGCGLVLAHAIGLCTGFRWPSADLAWILSIAPVATGLLTLGIVAPGGSPSGPFANDVWNRWSPGTRFVAKMILRIGWLGNIAVLAALFHLHLGVLKSWELTTEIAASLLISLLYASQVLLIHFGRIREPEPNTGPLPG
jgi:hypothetical protein